MTGEPLNARKPKIGTNAPDDGDLTVIYRDPRNLQPDPRNARTHSEEQIAQIRASIRQFGFTNPILLRDDDATIGAGHGRQLGALAEGLERVPTITLRGLTEIQWRAYAIADNQLALNAGWDVAVLKAEFAALRLMDFDLGLLGFSGDEIGAVMAFGASDGLTDPDEAPEPPASPVSRLGDVWLLGAHRLVCGDATKADDVALLCGGATPDLANCDPPYGISVVKGASDGGAKAFGSVGGKRLASDPKHISNFGKVEGSQRGRVHGPVRKAIIQPGIYAPVIGDDSTDTAIAAYGVLKGLGVPAIVLWGGNYYADKLPPSRCWLVWDKENTGTFADAELAWTNQDAIVRLLRHQWSGLIKASERGERRVHPTQKPVALAEWVIETVAPDCKTVLDLFGGSGSTLIACEIRGKQAYILEMSPSYVDVMIQRWEKFTGLRASHEDGRSFSKISTDRLDSDRPGVGEGGRTPRRRRPDSSRLSSVSDRSGIAL